MFWFIAFVIVLIIAIINHSSAKARDQAAYWRGRNDERIVVQQMFDGRTEESISTDELRQLLRQPGSQTPQPYIEPSGTMPEMVAPQAVVTESVAEAPALDPTQWQPQPTPPVDSAEDKELRTIKNLNIMLYVGSFLIVAATALFVTLTMPAGVKLAGMIAMTLAFYITGLVLHQTSKRLRSAAVAFVGTGLAILPFVGFALTLLGGVTSEVSWLITSLVGVVAYMLAAVRLRNEFVSYATIAFVISLALSVVPVLQLSIMWYFIAIMLVSMASNIIHLLRPTLLPSVFSRPLRNSGLLMTPIALIASLFVMGTMTLGMYELLFALATLHYLVIWFATRRPAYELSVRALAHSTLSLVAIDIAQQFNPRDGVLFFAVVWTGLGVLQAVYSLLRVRLADQESRLREQAVIAIGLGLTLFAIPVWLAEAQSGHWLSFHVFAIGLICGLSAFRLRQVDWAYGSLASAVLLPFIVGRMVFEPALSYEIMAFVFAVAGAVSLVCLERLTAASRSAAVQKFCLSAVLVFALSVALCGLLVMSGMAIGWTMLVSATLFILASFVVASMPLEVVGVLIAIGSLAGWLDELLVHNQWKLTALIIVSTALVGLGAVLHHRYAQVDRRNALAVVAALLLPGLVFGSAYDNPLVTKTAVVVLLLAGIGTLVLRTVLANRSQTLRAVALAGYIAYPLLALLLSLTLGGGWIGLILMVVAAMAWASSYYEVRPGIMAVGHVVLFLGIMQLWSWLNFSSEWFIYGTAWIAAGVYYLWYWFSYDRTDQPRLYISLSMIGAVLLLPIAHGILAVGSTWTIASAASLLMGAVVLAVHGQIVKQPTYIEVAAYVATLGLQRIVSVVLPELEVVVYAHWWAITILPVALWRKDYLTRVVIGLAAITLPTGFYALVAGGEYALLFLIEHVIIAFAGAMLRRQWVMWWGVVAVLLAVIYFMRDYTVLLLLFLGLLIILFVVWRLLRGGQKK